MIFNRKQINDNNIGNQTKLKRMKRCLCLITFCCANMSSQSFLIPGRSYSSSGLKPTRSVFVRATPGKSNKYEFSSKNVNNNVSTKLKTTTKSSKNNKTSRRKNQRRLSYSGEWYQRDEMMQHDILTRDDEVYLGRKIILAKKLRDQMNGIIHKNQFDCFNDSDERVEFNDFENLNFLYNESFPSFDRIIAPTARSNLMAKLDFKADRRTASTLVQEGSKLSASSLECAIDSLSDDDIINTMGVKGGRDELRQVLFDGVEARDILMRSNIRLVVSISKKWVGGSSLSRSGDASRMSNVYGGGWDRPSLDEVIQEGVLGLARAVDKYNPDRGLRFSTYSTHWITSYVRQTLQEATTGCLKVPAQLHEIKSTYKSIVKRYIDSSEPLPAEEDIADEIGVSVSRLRTAIRVTETLLSVDEPAYSGGNYKGSGAGGDLTGEKALLIIDRLECEELPPEHHVEVSFLRQSLENAMAAELSPHERDIIRLRLGLDDGQTRTIKEVVKECGGSVSVNDVRSAERRAFKKLRSPNSLYAHNLLAYFEIAGIDLDTCKAVVE